MNSLIKNIMDWGIERELNTKGNIKVQIEKITEELFKLGYYIQKNDKKGIKDSIGDVFIATSIATLLAYNSEDLASRFLKEKISSLNLSENDYSSDTSISLIIKTLHYTSTISCFEDVSIDFIIEHTIPQILLYLNGIAIKQNTNLSECVKFAFNEIKDRKGEIINGSFVKNKS